MQPADTAGPPAGLDPSVTYRENRIEADCETLQGMRKVGRVGGFEILCDESARVGGEGTAPSPLGYFTAAIGFWLLTQVSRFGHMLKIAVRKARVHVTMRNKQEGSVLQGTMKATCLGIETRLELESDEPTERIATLVRTAEAGCFTLQALLGNPPVTTTVTLNGAPLE